MDVDVNKLYEELLGPEEDHDDNFTRVSDRLIDLVIHASDIIAERVNSQDAPEQIRWLLEKGFTEAEIKEFVGRTG